MDLALNRNPIVISASCYCGAYDTNLVDSSYKKSFGESILLSDAGGIAYIGGPRINYITHIFTVNNGQIEIIKEAYMTGLLTHVIKAYHDDGGSLGNLTKNALITYLEENDMSNDDIYSFF